MEFPRNENNRARFMAGNLTEVEILEAPTAG